MVIWWWHCWTSTPILGSPCLWIPCGVRYDVSLSSKSLSFESFVTFSLTPTLLSLLNKLQSFNNFLLSVNSEPGSVLGNGIIIENSGVLMGVKIKGQWEHLGVGPNPDVEVGKASQRERCLSWNKRVRESQQANRGEVGTEMGEGETFQAEGREYARVGRRKHSKWKEMNLECKIKGKYTVMGRLVGPHQSGLWRPRQDFLVRLAISELVVFVN